MKYKINGGLYGPVKVGGDGDWYESEGDDEACGNCGAPHGEYHFGGCDIERNLLLWQQLISRLYQ